MSTTRFRLLLVVLACGTLACPLNLDYLDSAPAQNDGGDAMAAEPDDGANDARPDANDARADASLVDGDELDSASEVLADGRAEETGSEEAGTEAGVVNLIQNPGFELGTTPWITFSDGANLALVEASRTFAHSGTFSGHVSNRTRTYQGAVQDIRAAVVGGHAYQCSAWVLVAPGADGGTVAAQPIQLTAAVTCLADGGQMQNFIPIGVSTANSSSWTQIGGTLILPQCNPTVVDIYVEGPAAGVDLYVDDTVVTP